MAVGNMFAVYPYFSALLRGVAPNFIPEAKGWRHSYIAFQKRRLLYREDSQI